MAYRGRNICELVPEMAPSSHGVVWRVGDLEHPKIMRKSNCGDSHPGP